ncbi:hypothetical protein ACFUN7_27850 [Streptomyces sp. NPDC057236]|uniref:hypothetical protein n=1 Tax=Streptomyces sp. NPDC057236 TaxID=3346059 RepID=UPI0036347C0E
MVDALAVADNSPEPVVADRAAAVEAGDVVPLVTRTGGCTADATTFSLSGPVMVMVTGTTSCSS